MGSFSVRNKKKVLLFFLQYTQISDSFLGATSPKSNKRRVSVLLIVCLRERERLSHLLEQFSFLLSGKVDQYARKKKVFSSLLLVVKQVKLFI